MNRRNATYDESRLLTFQDKINWLIIHDTNILKANCADKILLHSYSKLKLGKDICNKILFTYNSIDDIHFEKLPEKFVLKTNHGSGFNIIIENKINYDIDSVKKLLSEWISIDFGNKLSEFHYSFIKPKVFAEEYIGEHLRNYKFLCYNGKPKYVYLSVKKDEQKFRNFYDMEWNFLEFKCLSFPDNSTHYDKPKYFELMKKYAAILSEDFKFVRVDMYELDNEVRLGELTFTPMDSFFLCNNITHEIELGNNIIISNSDKFCKEK